jgi:hypothetical protein
MHFKTPKLGFNIAAVDDFIKGKEVEERDCLDVTPDNLNSFKKIVVLKPQR